ncbi:MAG: MBOAT family O-acyltransferase, partial [Aurantibacter sp.]
DNAKKFDYHRIKDGLILMALGFFKKMVIADRLAILVNTVFNNPVDYKGFEIIIATVFFAFQILCDFSGYTDIAIGAAKVLGFDLMKNFDRPYFSKSIPEFWRRWHISLGAWFRDYVYFPLGGNRVSEWKKYRNILIVFVASGLWHGASWNFLIWGFLHGIYYVLDSILTPVAKKSNFTLGPFWKRAFKLSLTFTLVCFAWIFFRANTLDDAWLMIENIFVFNPDVIIGNGMYDLGLDRREFKVSLISIGALLLFDMLEGKFNFFDLMRGQHFTLRWTFYIILVLSILIFGIYGSNEKAPFIYFQF